jgi:UDP-N-acetylglucosamine 2-epimerase (non-hydrolysing)
MVASLHRFQNIFDGKRLRFLVELLGGLSARYPVHFVLHPATRKRLEKEGLMDSLARFPRLKPMPRLGYTQFLALAAGAAAVLTDGGSNQEELAVLGVPTLVMRQATERPDGLGANAVMEADLGQDVLGFCLSGGFETLRRPSRVGTTMGPSVVVANRLAA